MAHLHLSNLWPHVWCDKVCFSFLVKQIWSFKTARNFPNLPSYIVYQRLWLLGWQNVYTSAILSYKWPFDWRWQKGVKCEVVNQDRCKRQTSYGTGSCINAWGMILTICRTCVDEYVYVSAMDRLYAIHCHTRILWDNNFEYDIIPKRVSAVFWNHQYSEFVPP